MLKLLTLVLAVTLDQSSIVGDLSMHVVQPGDSLTLIGARYGVSVKHLAAINALSSQAKLTVGQELYIENRHIVPDGPHDGIVINIPQRMLFFFSQGRLLSHYPTAVGSRGWPTVIGDFTIVRKEENPTWDVPPSIQAEMRRKGQRVVTKVPPSPANPLGAHYLALSASGYGIHGTNSPASIYTFQTHGCIRLHPEDIADLFSRVSIGTPVHIIYEPVLIAQSGGKLFVEVNPDMYRRSSKPIEILERLLSALRSRLDWTKVVQAATDPAGIAQPLTIAQTAQSARRVPVATKGRIETIGTLARHVMDK
jgi:L,D-transpeptidase ErfK/SrfK